MGESLLEGLEASPYDLDDSFSYLRLAHFLRVGRGGVFAR
jgi:hypothetical protein